MNGKKAAQLETVFIETKQRGGGCGESLRRKLQKDFARHTAMPCCSSLSLSVATSFTYEAIGMIIITAIVMLPVCVSHPHFVYQTNVVVIVGCVALM